MSHTIAKPPPPLFGIAPMPSLCPPLFGMPPHTPPLVSPQCLARAPRGRPPVLVPHSAVRSPGDRQDEAGPRPRRGPAVPPVHGVLLPPALLVARGLGKVFFISNF